MSKSYITIIILNIILILKIVPLNFFSLPIIKRIITKEQYQKIFINYNITIKLSKYNSKDIDKEYLINTTLIPEKFLKDFTYTGKIITFNNSNFEIISDNYYKNKILVIKTNETFNNYIQNQNINKDLIKVIIIPPNIINNFNITSKNFFEKLFFVIIELEENIIKVLEELKENDNIKIMSKKYDMLPFKFFNIMLLSINFIIIFFLLLYEYISKIYVEKIKFEIIIYYSLIFKVFVLIILFIELNELHSGNHIIIFSFFQVILIIINTIIKTFLIYYYLDQEINKKYEDQRVNNNFKLCSFLYCLLYLPLSIFVNLLLIPKLIYTNIIFIMPIYSKMIHSLISLIIFLFKIISVLRKNKKQYRKYSYSIILKIFMDIFQLIILLFVAYLHLCLYKYFVLKNEFCFNLEKDILFQSLESISIFLIALIYIPRKMNKGLNLDIQMTKEIKCAKSFKISSERKNYNSFNFNSLIKILSVKKYIRKNSDKEFIVLNPRAIVLINKKSNMRVFSKNIFKIGKLRKIN